MFGFEPGNTVDTRINRVATSDGVIGYALDALKEGFFGERALSLILLEYEALARAPRPTLQHLYAYLDEPHFEHDFENVEYDADEFDLAVGMPGLHRIRRRVESVERQTVLPPELFQRFVNDMSWRVPEANFRQVPIIRSQG